MKSCGFSEWHVITTGVVEVLYEIGYYETDNGERLYDYRSLEAIESDEWFPTAQEAETAVHRRLE